MKSPMSRGSSSAVTTAPNWWWLLDESDKAKYFSLQLTIATANFHQSSLYDRTMTFPEALNLIKEYCIRNEDKDKVRCLVCGVYWFPEQPEQLAINIHQLIALMRKCKSSINGSLLKMGLSVCLGRAESSSLLTKVFPLYFDQSEARKWTVRSFTSRHNFKNDQDESKEQLQNIFDQTYLNRSSNNNKCGQRFPLLSFDRLICGNGILDLSSLLNDNINNSHSAIQEISLPFLFSNTKNSNKSCIGSSTLLNCERISKPSQNIIVQNRMNNQMVYFPPLNVPLYC